MKLFSTDNSLLLIILCAVVTYLLRLGGLLLAEKIPSEGRFKVFLNSLPGCLLIAYVAPEIIKAGMIGHLAALITILVTLKTKNILVSSLAGILMMLWLN